MARGWESKSVESQIDSAESERLTSEKKRLTPEMAAAVRKKESLLLARTRLLQQMEANPNPRYREMMERALAELDKTLAKLPAA